jgi:AcrR family transcriptional regulator
MIMSVKSRKELNTETTRRALLKAARELFGTRGFSAVSVGEIARCARVTTGALYHHFESKEAIFRSVFEEVNRELAKRSADRAGEHADVWDQLIGGFEAFLDACREDDVRTIVLIDAPSVLGWEQWREVDAPYGLRLLKAGLRSAMDAGVLEPKPVVPLAHLLYGAINEAGLLLARAEDFDAARSEMLVLLNDMLRGLKPG